MILAAFVVVICVVGVFSALLVVSIVSRYRYKMPPRRGGGEEGGCGPREIQIPKISSVGHSCAENCLAFCACVAANAVSQDSWPKGGRGGGQGELGQGWKKANIGYCQDWPQKQW